MSLPALDSAFLTQLAITVGLAVVALLALWIVVRSAVLSALTADRRRQRAGEKSAEKPAAKSTAQSAMRDAPPAVPDLSPVPIAPAAENTSTAISAPAGSGPTAANPYATPALPYPDHLPRPSTVAPSYPTAAPSYPTAPPPQTGPPAPLPQIPLPQLPAQQLPAQQLPAQQLPQAPTMPHPTPQPIIYPQATEPTQASAYAVPLPDPQRAGRHF